MTNLENIIRKIIRELNAAQREMIGAAEDDPRASVAEIASFGRDFASETRENIEAMINGKNCLFLFDWIIEDLAAGAIKYADGFAFTMPNDVYTSEYDAISDCEFKFADRITATNYGERLVKFIDEMWEEYQG